MNYKFKCKCGGEVIEEVLTGVTQFSKIENIYVDTDNSIECEYAPTPTTTEDGDIDTITYQCASCGEAISEKQMVVIAKRLID